MASQTCEQCGAIVAKDEQFCPSCGSFIDPMATPPAPRPRPIAGKNVISVSSDGNYEEFSLEEPPPRKQPTSRSGSEAESTGITCPSCQAVNPPNNRHCQECGARLQQGPLPTAPRPAVQATAGVRAALAISGLLFIVVVAALLFNVLSGDGAGAENTTTTTTSTTIPIPEVPEPIDVLQENCTPEGISSFICANLTNGIGTEYQVNWEEISQEGVLIELVFEVPMAISQIQWTNIEDETRFLQNYRAKSIEIRADDTVTPIQVPMNDQRGTQSIAFASLNTLRLTIQIFDVYLAEVVAENRFDDLAIDEIVAIGYPANTTGTGGTTSSTAPPSTEGG